MKSTQTLPILAAAWLCAGMPLFSAPDAWAEFFRYTDSSGIVVITNRLEDVPQKYRKKVKVVWDRELEAKDPLARRSASAERGGQQRGAQQEQRKSAETGKPAEKSRDTEGKTLVITYDDETGQVTRKFE